MRRRDDWRPRIQGTNEEFSFCDEYDFCLSVSRSLFDTNARWIIIFHRGRLAVVSLDHLFLIIIFWMTMLFLTPRFEKTHRNASSRKNEDACLSLSLSVCLSLSLSRRGKEEQTTRNKSHHRTKKGTDEKASPQSSSHSRSKKSNTFARRVPRKEEEEDTRERVLSLLRAVLRLSLIHI